MRNSMDAQEIAVGWWPGDCRYPRPAFYGYAHPATPGYADARLGSPDARWEPALREFVLDWEYLRRAADPHRAAVEFGRSLVTQSCAVCGWDPALAATIDGVPPPIPEARRRAAILPRWPSSFLEVGAHGPERDQQGGQHRAPTGSTVRANVIGRLPAGLKDGGATTWGMPSSLAALPARCRRATCVEGRPGHVP
jgi:Family of unknown function (DUF5996)